MSPGKVLETIHLNLSPDPCTVFQGETVSLTQPLSILRPVSNLMLGTRVTHLWTKSAMAHPGLA